MANTFTNRVMFGPKGCRENGSFDASVMMSRAGQIMISHWKGNFFANALRRTDSLTSARTTNVPTAPMLITPNRLSCFASSAGRQRFVPPTFTARRKTTQRIGLLTSRNLRSMKAENAIDWLEKSQQRGLCYKSAAEVNPRPAWAIPGPFALPVAVVAEPSRSLVCACARGEGREGQRPGVLPDSAEWTGEPELGAGNSGECTRLA